MQNQRIPAQNRQHLMLMRIFAVCVSTVALCAVLVAGGPAVTVAAVVIWILALLALSLSASRDLNSDA
jgi:hypothetical protein